MCDEQIKWTQERIAKAADLLEDANVRICVFTTLHENGDKERLAQAMTDLQEFAFDIQTFLGPYGNGPIDDEILARDGQGGRR